MYMIVSVRYDFSQPLSPVAVSPLVTFPTDPEKAINVPYTVGAINAQQVVPTAIDDDDPFTTTETQSWVVLVSKDGVTAEFHFLDIM